MLSVEDDKEWSLTEEIGEDEDSLRYRNMFKGMGIHVHVQYYQVIYFLYCSIVMQLLVRLLWTDWQLP